MMPKVSIITPTTSDRYNFNYLCEQYGIYQAYDAEIEHLFDYGAETIGEKLNRLCEQATGEIIIRFDSDDFYSKHWVRLSVEALLQSGADVTGLSNAYYYQPGRKCLKYTYGGSQFYAIGNSLCFTKEAWARDKFKHISNGEDLYFLHGKNVRPHDHINHFCSIIHGSNITGINKYYSKSYNAVDMKIPQMIMGDSFKNY